LKNPVNLAKPPAIIFAYSCGIISAFVFGTGMCLAMQIIDSSMALGIIVGMFCLVGCGVNYPIYSKIPEKGKAK